jgi:hypothetical protein
MVSQELQGDYMSRPNKKLEKYISLNEKIKKLTKEKDQLRSELIDGVGIIVQGADIIGVDHFATVKLKNRYICNLSTLLDKYPNAWKKYHNEDIIKMIVYPTINYKLKDRKVA